MSVALLTGTVNSSKQITHQADEYRVQSVAESITALAVSQIWMGFERSTKGGVQRTGDLRFYLESMGYPDQAGVGEPKGLDYLATLNLAESAAGELIMDGINVDSCEVYRIDSGSVTRLVVTTEASGGGGLNNGSSRRLSKRVRQSFTVEPEDWEGLEYALFANNINCLTCHLTVDNAQRVYNTDPSRYSSFDRVRMGSLQSFQLRMSPESSIAGSIYLGGEAIGGDGKAVSNWPSLTLKSSEFDSSGKLQEDAWGDLLATHLSPASSSAPESGENLYVGYFDGGLDEQVDGYMPSSFPSPFPDDGGFDPVTGEATPSLADNRVLDSNEFMAAVTGANGQVTGGTISVVDKGDKVRGNPKLLTGGTTSALNGVTEGSVYLNGTKENPIQLNGEMAIDGDLVITGYVKGEGSFKVSGNVYMPGDVKYADGQDGNGDRTYGVASDGTSNSLAVASSGNISVGDFYKPAFDAKKKVTGKSNGNFNFIMEEMANFNRMEWTKTQATLPGKTYKKQVGTKTWTQKVKEKKKVSYMKTVNVYKWVKTGKKIKKTKYKWVKKNNGLAPPYYKQWNEKVANGFYWKDEKKKVKTGTKQVKKYKWVYTGKVTFVKKSKPKYKWVTPKYANPGYQGSDFIARYYAFSEGDPVVIHNKGGYWDEDNLIWQGEETALKWDKKKLTIANPSDKKESLLFKSNGQARAVVSVVAGTKDWIDDEAMRKLIGDVQSAHDPDAPIEVDALLYSNNSIFGVLNGSANSNGKLLFNGGIVAANIGLLAPAGINLNWDNRGASMLDIASDTDLVIRRSLWVAPGH